MWWNAGDAFCPGLGSELAAAGAGLPVLLPRQRYSRRG